MINDITPAGFIERFAMCGKNITGLVDIGMHQGRVTALRLSRLGAELLEAEPAGKVVPVDGMATRVAMECLAGLSSCLAHLPHGAAARLPAATRAKLVGEMRAFVASRLATKAAVLASSDASASGSTPRAGAGARRRRQQLHPA